MNNVKDEGRIMTMIFNEAIRQEQFLYDCDNNIRKKTYILMSIIMGVIYYLFKIEYFTSMFDDIEIYIMSYIGLSVLGISFLFSLMIIMRVHEILLGPNIKESLDLNGYEIKDYNDFIRKYIKCAEIRIKRESKHNKDISSLYKYSIFMLLFSLAIFLLSVE